MEYLRTVQLRGVGRARMTKGMRYDISIPESRT